MAYLIPAISPLLGLDDCRYVGILTPAGHGEADGEVDVEFDGGTVEQFLRRSTEEFSMIF